MSSVRVRPVAEDDHAWVVEVLAAAWGSPQIVTRGRIHHANRLPGFVATLGGERAGVLTYRIEGAECEIVTLNALRERRGVGTALLAAAERAAREAGCSRVWLITTNDNIPALRFYQRRGFVLAALYPNALEASRALKPEISLIGLEGIPLRDEIELELPLNRPA